MTGRLGAAALAMMALGDLAAGLLVLQLQETGGAELVSLALPAPSEAASAEPMAVVTVVPGAEAPTVTMPGWATAREPGEAATALVSSGITRVAVAVGDDVTFGQALRVQEELVAAEVIVVGFGKRGGR